MVTRDELYSIASSVRRSYSDPHGQCYPASKDLRKALADETEISRDGIRIEEVLMGPSATRRHYVVAFPANAVEDMNAAGRIIIDITLDQYCTEFEDAGKVETSIGPKSSIAEVNIYASKSEAPYTG